MPVTSTGMVPRNVRYSLSGRTCKTPSGLQKTMEHIEADGAHPKILAAMREVIRGEGGQEMVDRFRSASRFFMGLDLHAHSAYPSAIPYGGLLYAEGLQVVGDRYAFLRIASWVMSAKDAEQYGVSSTSAERMLTLCVDTDPEILDHSVRIPATKQTLAVPFNAQEEPFMVGRVTAGEYLEGLQESPALLSDLRSTIDKFYGPQEVRAHQKYEAFQRASQPA